MEAGSAMVEKKEEAEEDMIGRRSVEVLTIQKCQARALLIFALYF